ncbi:MAG: DUF3455 domain-containing protein [Vicinamibacterales bacterium]
MIGNLARAFAAGVIVLTLGLSSAMAQPGARSGNPVPPVPADLEVGAGYSLFFKAHAIGTQDYVCLPSASGVAWKQIAPQATLYESFRGFSQQVATHFLSPNVDESGLLRPTWQHSFDSSRVWARVVQPSTDANYVEAGAIPWLLLAVVGDAAGPMGGDFLTRAKKIQRLNTSGGVAPATGCTQSTDLGALALVPYTADYFFYRAWPPQ